MEKLNFSNSVHQIVQGQSPQHPNLDTLLKANQAGIFCHPFRTIIRTVNSIEDIKDNNDKVLFFNGLSDCDTYKALFDGVIQQEQTKLFWILLV